MKAKLTNCNQSPRKIRPVANWLKGLSVSEALARLDLVPKKSGPALKRLIASAAANAKNNFDFTSDDELLVEDIRVDKGLMLKRMRAAARGRAVRIRHQRSHIAVDLSSRPVAASKKEAEVPVAESQKGSEEPKRSESSAKVSNSSK